MVEYQHPAGAGCLGDEAYGFGIIDAAQLNRYRQPSTRWANWIFGDAADDIGAG